MKITVITAVRNRSDVISEALDSVMHQTWSDVEHIVIDGASDDGTLEILQARRSQLTQLVSEPDRGIYDALNKGLVLASGDVIGLMHSDDYYADNRVLEHVATELQNADVDGVYGDLEYVSKHDISNVVRTWRAGRFSIDRLRRGWMPPHPTLFLRREVIDQWGGYDTSYQIAADYDAMLRYLGKGGIRLAYIPEVLVRMRTGGESNRSIARILQKSREDYRALRANEVGGITALLWKNLGKLPQLF